MTAPPNRIRAHREAAGLTQGELAEQAGIGRVTLNRVEQGTQTPSLSAAIALAEALDVTLDDLFGWDDERETPKQAYWRGRREAERGIEPDTPPSVPQSVVDSYRLAVDALARLDAVEPDNTFRGRGALRWVCDTLAAAYGRDVLEARIAADTEGDS